MGEGIGGLCQLGRVWFDWLCFGVLKKVAEAAKIRC